MKIKKLLQDFKNAAMDPERDVTERLFLILTVVSELTVLAAFIGNILIDENIIELTALLVTLVFVPISSFVGLYKDRFGVVQKLIVFGLIFILLPILFFFGGGIEGGGILWVIFTFLYVGSVISGPLRNTLLVMLTLITVLCYAVAYMHPEYVQPHSRLVFYIDSLLSVILVGVVCFIISWVQRRIFDGESRRAKEAAQHAEELARAQNRFFSSMSHEIRTPINSILGLNELILRDQGASDEIVRDASGIQGAGKMLLSLINDILDFSKMEAGSMDIVPVDYNIGDTLSEIVNMVWLRAKDKGLKFEVSVDPNVPSVLYGDEVRVKQVMINRLNNAIKYTEKGSVSLHVESRDVDENTTELHIVVSDTGIGIKKEALPVLFDAFKRVDQQKNRMIEGTGLGLSIVKQITQLMDGEVTVNSVYGEGSVFAVVLRQGITGHDRIGELNIHNQQVVRQSAYESSFKAPDAAVLIVDDNEMNLEVEKRLLKETGMVIDIALSGKDALELCLKRHYDVILMDHLMPEMDGIECMTLLRRQTGGLNRTTPVIVLTANAGSENRELYNRSGFDGYLVKPVSGEILEELLLKHISPEKLIISGKLISMHDDINAGASYIGKAQVLITATSMCDLPDKVVRNLGLNILPFRIRTDKGVFKDNVNIDAGEFLRYLKRGGEAASMPPDEAAFTEFFSDVLKRAHYVIHITITTGMSDEYRVATEAAKSFDNVIVINSECLSSSTGLLVLIAHKLAQQGLTVEEIVSELEIVKQKLKCSFIIDSTDYMARRRLISPSINKLANMLNLHPCLSLKNDKSTIGGIWAGSIKRSYMRYIRSAFPVDVTPDLDLCFITYVDVPMEILLAIREEVAKIAHFERIVFQQASAAISSNCGPGTFGILYFAKGSRSYNISSYFEYDIDEAAPDAESDISFTQEQGDLAETEEAANDTEAQGATIEQDEKKWYQKIEAIDSKAALANSGSEDALKTVIKIFYDSSEDKAKELEGFFETGDYKNYTIKVHALKSSSKLIGAMKLAEEAQQLESAGKEEKYDYIKDKHPVLMQHFGDLRAALSDFFEKENKSSDDGEDKPAADEFLLESVYEGIKAAAEAMDCDGLEEVLKEIEGYSIVGEDGKKIEEIRQKAQNFDYDGILGLLS